MEMTRTQIEQIIQRFGRFVDPICLERRREIEAEALRFCAAHLDDEWSEIVRQFMGHIEDEQPELLGRGDVKIYAAGVIHLLGQLNDEIGERLANKQIANFYGVKSGSMTQRSAMLRDATGVHPLDGKFLTADNLAMVEDTQSQMVQMVAALSGAPVEMVLAEMPKFGARRSSRQEFVDIERDARDDFYDLTVKIESATPAKAEKALRNLIKQDADFFDGTLMLANLLVENDRDDEAETLTQEAYLRALNLICNARGEWPEFLEWGWLENRHILRLFAHRAITWWQQSQNAAALDLMQKLLRVCPDDNQGMRYLMLALLEKMDFDTFDERFAPEGYWDERIGNWFDERAPQHPEFNAWLQWAKAQE